MKFAVIADIHGNSAALRAVLDDMAQHGVETAVNLGDHFSGPLDAKGSADILMARDFPSILGNHDRLLLTQDPAEMGPSDKVAHDQLTPQHRAWLADLPPTRHPFPSVFMCHGTPSSDTTYWLEKVTPDGGIRQASYTEIEREADASDASLILCAHTHVPRLIRLADGRVIVNPGSVGCPAYDDDTPVYHVMQTGAPNASYAIAERADDAWTITFRSLPYDASGMADLALQNGRDDWARAVATGWL